MSTPRIELRCDACGHKYHSGSCDGCREGYGRVCNAFTPDFQLLAQSIAEVNEWIAARSPEVSE